MAQIPFYKMSGSGNDFIVIDNRRKIVDESDLAGLVAKVCRRKMSVGADGFILVESSDNVDFKWRFFNSDGSLAEMCGNGARCAARFAELAGVAGKKMSFETAAGVVSAEVDKDRVKIKMPDPFDLKTDYILELGNGSLSICSLNTGVPHVVIPTDNLDRVDVVKQGRKIRYHKAFAPAGTNVNFVSVMENGVMAIRTYERGVEDETLACGTGSAAGALVMAQRRNLASPVSVLTRSGAMLKIHFEENGGAFSDVYLEGDARVVYTGVLWTEAWQY